MDPGRDVTCCASREHSAVELHFQLLNTFSFCSQMPFALSNVGRAVLLHIGCMLLELMEGLRA